MFWYILEILLIIYLFIGAVTCILVSLGYENMPNNEINILMKKSLKEAGLEFNKENKIILIVIIYLVTLFFHPIITFSAIKKLGGKDERYL